MAESQVQYDYTDAGQVIRGDLSEERFTPYMESAGWHEEYAFKLYLYNARLSKSFLYPLHILEVVLRNRINSIFCSVYGPYWPRDPSFIAVLTQESKDALANGIRRADSSNTEDVVATLTFDFWSNLFRPEYDRALWQTQMSVLLPNHTKTRKEFQLVVKKFNKLRNRIAHHEPIHSMDLSKYHQEILEAIKWMSPPSGDWVKHHSTVNSVMRTKPSANGEPKPHFKERCDTDCSLQPLSLSLDTLPASRFLACTADDGSIIAIAEKVHISNYLLSLVEDGELLVGLADHTLDMVITSQSLKDNYVVCSGDESLAKASRLFKGKINYLLIQNGKNVLGVIAKAHRRY